MRNYFAFNTPTIKHSILSPTNLLLRPVLVTYLLHHLILCMDNRKKKQGYKEMKRRITHSWTRSCKYIEVFRSNLIIDRNSIKLGMTSTRRITNSMSKTRCGFTSVRSDCKEKSKNSIPLDMDHLTSLNK
jgi:hypothetical protein